MDGTSHSFFKIMIGDFRKHLQIPPAFVKYFNGVIPHKSTIMRSPASKLWCVYVENMERSLFFQKGWSEFVQDNFLELGDFLLFHYHENAKFEVKVYGRNCCEKFYLATANNCEPPPKKDEMQEESTRVNQERGERSTSPPSFCRFTRSMARRGLKSKEEGEGGSGADGLQAKRSEVINIESDSSSCGDTTDYSANSATEGETDMSMLHDQPPEEVERKHRASKLNLKQPIKEEEEIEGGQFERKTSYNRRRLPKHIKDRALEAASQFVSNHPFFKVVMQHSYISRGYLRIPKRFSRKNITGISRKATLCFSDRLWDAKVLVSQNWPSVITSGWLEFVRENRLRAGDLCVFEMIESNSFVFNVSFFRRFA